MSDRTPAEILHFRRIRQAPAVSGTAQHRQACWRGPGWRIAEGAPQLAGTRRLLRPEGTARQNGRPRIGSPLSHAAECWQSQGGPTIADVAERQGTNPVCFDGRPIRFPCQPGEWRNSAYQPAEPPRVDRAVVVTGSAADSASAALPVPATRKHDRRCRRRHRHPNKGLPWRAPGDGSPDIEGAIPTEKREQAQPLLRHLMDLSRGIVQAVPGSTALQDEDSNSAFLNPDYTNEEREEV
jgi:hypothetical protein